MNAYFLSYSHSDAQEVTALAQQLKARGLRLWRDADDLPAGKLSEKEIRRAIAEECCGLIVYLTPNAMASDFVTNLELPVAIGRRKIDLSFSIFPVFRHVTVEDARRYSLKRLGVDLTTNNGYVIGGDEVSAVQLLRHLACATRKVLQTTYLPQALPSDGATAKSTILDFHTWPQRWTNPPGTLDLDWTPFFPDEAQPAPEVWKFTLLPALCDVKNALAETVGPCTLRLRAKARLSAGIAIGFTFRLTSGFHLEIEQYGDVWSTKIAPRGEEPLEKAEEDVFGDVGSRELAVALSITQDATPLMNRIVEDQGRDFRVRLHFKPTAGWGTRSIPDGQCALDMAKQIRQLMQDALGLYRCRGIHLFAAMPFGLAVLLGHQMNACGPIQCYEVDRASGCCRPSCLLCA